MGAAGTASARKTAEGSAAEEPPAHPRRPALARQDRRAVARPAGAVRPVAHGGDAVLPLDPGRGCGSASSPSCGASRTPRAGSTGRCTWSTAPACGRTAAPPAGKGAAPPGAGPLARRLRQQAAPALRPPRPADGVRADAGRAEREGGPAGADAAGLRQAPRAWPAQAPPQVGGRRPRLVGRLKEYRRIATRYDKLAASYLAFVQLAAIRMWL